MDELATLLFAASAGERNAVIEFLKAFKEANLLLICKEQVPPLPSSVHYPDRPLNIFATKDGENTVIPAFTNKGLLENWINRPIQARSLSTKELLTIIPENWWLILNPGDEARKDFSPWELKKILGDEADLLEIATELELEYSAAPIVVRKLLKTEFTELRKALLAFLLSKQQVTEIYLAIEEAKTVEETVIETLLIGIRMIDSEREEMKNIRSEIKDLVAPLLIGSVQLRILQGSGFNDIELGIFADITPEISKLIAESG